MPTFSVLIPAYNAQGHLARAINSVLGQSHPAHEIIVVDDGSTDDTWAIMSAFGDRIQRHRQPNGGLSSARNRALTSASGDYVVLLDADDEWFPNYLAAVVGALRDAPWADIVTTDAEIRHADGRAERYYANRAFPAPTDQHVEILRGNFIFVSSAIRREALERIGGFEAGLVHDSEYATWVRLILGGSRVAKVAGVNAVYHRGPASLSTQRARSHRMRLQVMDMAEALGPLTPAQASAMADTRVELGSLLLTHRAIEALEQRAPDAGALLRRAALHGVMRPSRRPLALLASLAPRGAAAALDRLPPDRRPRGS